MKHREIERENVRGTEIDTKKDNDRQDFFENRQRKRVREGEGDRNRSRCALLSLGLSLLQHTIPPGHSPLRPSIPPCASPSLPFCADHSFIPTGKMNVSLPQRYNDCRERKMREWHSLCEIM